MIRFYFTALAIANIINVFVSLILVAANIKWADKFFVSMSVVFLLLICLLYIININDEKEIKKNGKEN